MATYKDSLKIKMFSNISKKEPIHLKSGETCPFEKICPFVNNPERCNGTNKNRKKPFICDVEYLHRRD